MRPDTLTESAAQSRPRLTHLQHPAWRVGPKQRHQRVQGLMCHVTCQNNRYNLSKCLPLVSPGGPKHVPLRQHRHSVCLPTGGCDCCQGCCCQSQQDSGCYPRGVEDRKLAHRPAHQGRSRCVPQAAAAGRQALHDSGKSKVARKARCSAPQHRTACRAGLAGSANCERGREILQRSYHQPHLIVSRGAHSSTATAMMSSRASMLADGPKASHSSPLHSGGSPSKTSLMTTWNGQQVEVWG